MALGAYALGNIGWNLMRFNSCPEAAEELQKVSQSLTEGFVGCASLLEMDIVSEYIDDRVFGYVCPGRVCGAGDHRSIHHIIRSIEPVKDIHDADLSPCVTEKGTLNA